MQTTETVRRSTGTQLQTRVQLDWPADREFRILSIDGGGLKGMFPAAFLAELEATYLSGSSISEHFDLITGTSTGGIIALGLGAGFTAARLLKFYEDHGAKIFPLMRFRSIRSLFAAPYNNAVLHEALVSALGTTLFGTSRPRLCIPSFDGRYGEVYIYKTDHHPDYKQDHLQEMVTVGMATSAAPTFLKPHAHEGYTFIDGGVWANNPIMIGLVDALACYNVSRQKIRILSVGCGSEPYIVSRAQTRFGGLLSWRTIIFAAMSLQSQNALGQAGLLIGRDKIKRIDPSDALGGLRMDDFANCSISLPADARKTAQKYGDDIAAIFFKDKAAPYVKKQARSST